MKLALVPVAVALLVWMVSIARVPLDQLVVIGAVLLPPVIGVVMLSLLPPSDAAKRICLDTLAPLGLLAAVGALMCAFPAASKRLNDLGDPLVGLVTVYAWLGLIRAVIEWILQDREVRRQPRRVAEIRHGPHRPIPQNSPRR
ncbi:hypothetical protein [Tessaracoccus defluvii]|uniref:Uncharacterized protein n=1 Tax=Tessaracoccus defluvii TaxID=1285901 RepID=A0A7H0H7G1_9ACTN|nr:hypothetical protein [Tessaracoccus defluvii]QNP56477.1 hypothetical protein H9L22_03330 [Tessaracoccus defluvii]